MNEAAPQTAVPAAGFGEITAEMLRATFDHWRIFEKDVRWWAMREGTTATNGPRSLIHPVLCATSLEGLAEQLSLQEWLRRMTAAELEAVWRGGFTSAAQDDSPQELGEKLDAGPGTCW
jgi:hypothetical protein